MLGISQGAAIPNAEFVGLESDGYLLLGREAASKAFVDAVRAFINGIETPLNGRSTSKRKKRGKAPLIVSLIDPDFLVVAQ